MKINTHKTFLINIILVTGILVSGISFAQPGIMKIGFDIDDTVLYSRYVFQDAPRDKNNHLDFGWINSRDRELSIPIAPTITLVRYFHLNGHEVYFITARSGENGHFVAEYLSDVVGFDVKEGINLFFSPKEKIDGNKFTTKHKVMKYLDLDMYYGDSDSDIMAAIKADVYPIRIVRHHSSVKQYSSNYFGNTLLKDKSIKTPFNSHDLKLFYDANVGMFGESIYPILWDGPEEDKVERSKIPTDVED